MNVSEGERDKKKALIVRSFSRDSMWGNIQERELWLEGGFCWKVNRIYFIWRTALFISKVFFSVKKKKIKMKKLCWEIAKESFLESLLKKKSGKAEFLWTSKPENKGRYCFFPSKTFSPSRESSRIEISYQTLLLYGVSLGGFQLGKDEDCSR